MIANVVRKARSAQTGLLCGVVFLGLAGVAFGQTAPQAATTPSAQPDAIATPKDTMLPAPVVTSLDVKPGDRWTFEVYNDVTGDLKFTASQAVTEIHDKTFNVQDSVTLPNAQTAGNPMLVVFDDNWNLLEDPIWKRRRGDPATGIKLPLKLGAKWETRFEAVRHKPEARMMTTASSNVTAWEHVKVHDGGDYDAFRIEVAETTRAIGNPKVATTKTTLWFAPEVNRYVKREIEYRVDGRLINEETEYLTDYTRRHDD